MRYQSYNYSSENRHLLNLNECLIADRIFIKVSLHSIKPETQAKEIHPVVLIGTYILKLRSGHVPVVSHIHPFFEMYSTRYVP